MSSGSAQLLETLHHSGKYSDLTIVCGSRPWKVHKNVICLQSDFFDAACSKGFKEAAENKIDLSEDPQDAVGAMIQFFYHSKYDTPDAGPSRFELHMSVYFLADKYLLQKLSEYSKSRILEQLRWSLDNYTSGRMVTTRIKAIYAQTNDRDNMLRARAVRMFEPHAEKFFADVQRFRALADAAPDFVSSLIQELAKHGAPPNITPGLPIYRCPGCKTNFRSDMKKADSRFFTHGLGRGCRYELSEKEWQAHRV